MNTFQPGDLAMILGHNEYWDGCIVKVTSPLSRHLSTSGKGHICEIAVFSPAMFDPARRPKYQKIGTDVGAWNVSSLELPKNFSALCPYCKGNSFCEVSLITPTGTTFKCKTHGLQHLFHDARTAEETKWLTPTSKWAWLSLAPLHQNGPQPTIEYPKPKSAPEPVCICDIFNFGCTCKRFDWENGN